MQEEHNTGQEVEQVKGTEKMIDLNDFSVNDNGEWGLPPDLSNYEYLRITKEKEIPLSEPIVKIGGKGIAAKGNITGISAQVKAGKTAICSVIHTLYNAKQNKHSLYGKG